MSLKTVSWWGISISVWVLIYQGAYNHVEWYENILQFYVGIITFLSILYVLFFKSFKVMAKQRSVPTRVAVTVGIFETVAFAGAGWFWSACIVLFGTFIEYLIYDVD